MSHSTEEEEPIRYYEWMLWKLRQERERDSEIR